MTDEELWEKWKKQQTSENEAALLRALEPIIFSEVRRWQGVLAPQLLEIEAKRLALEAAKNFSPKYGAKLSTHVSNQLKRLSRLTYTHQNIARIPENKVLRISAYQAAVSNLKDDLGRDPTVAEISEELCWPRSQVEMIQKMLHGEYTESGVPVPIFDKDNVGANTVSYAYHDLSPIQKKIFEHTTGWGGAKILDRVSLAKKLKITPAQLSYQKRKLVEELQSKL